MNHMRDISVVICAYTTDRWNDLVAAVKSIHQQTLQPREVIVVIDHNTELLGRAQSVLDGVIVIENREPRGLSGARNSGIAQAKGDIIAFMDEDAIAEPKWLERLSRDYADTHVLGIGGAVEPLWLSGQPGWFPQEFNWVVGCSYQGMPTTTTAVRNPIGCNMSFRRTVFETMGGFRHGIGRVGTRPVGDEETEIGIRTKRYWPNGVILYEPQARVHHRVPAHRANWRYFWSRCYAEGQSKAILSRIAGAKDGLSSERTYTLRTLPLGVMKGIADTLTGRDTQGFTRAIAIVTGLGVTTAGYVVGTVLGWLVNHEATDSSMLPVGDNQSLAADLVQPG